MSHLCAALVDRWRGVRACGCFGQAEGSLPPTAPGSLPGASPRGEPRAGDGAPTCAALARPRLHLPLVGPDPRSPSKEVGDPLRDRLDEELGLGLTCVRVDSPARFPARAAAHAAAWLELVEQSGTTRDGVRRSDQCSPAGASAHAAAQRAGTPWGERANRAPRSRALVRSEQGAGLANAWPRVLRERRRNHAVSHVPTTPPLGPRGPVLPSVTMTKATRCIEQERLHAAAASLAQGGFCPSTVEWRPAYSTSISFFRRSAGNASFFRSEPGIVRSFRRAFWSSCAHFLWEEEWNAHIQ